MPIFSTNNDGKVFFKDGTSINCQITDFNISIDRPLVIYNMGQSQPNIIPSYSYHADVSLIPKKKAHELMNVFNDLEKIVGLELKTTQKNSSFFKNIKVCSASFKIDDQTGKYDIDVLFTGNIKDVYGDYAFQKDYLIRLKHALDKMRDRF